MGKQDIFSQTEQLFEVEIYVKSEDSFSFVQHIQLKHIPRQGEYFIPVAEGFGKPYLISAVVHDDMTTYLILVESATQFEQVMINRYNKGKAR